MLTKQIEQAVIKYAEASKWEHRCRVAYETCLDGRTDDGSDARETEAFSVHSEAELDKCEALAALTELLVEEP